MCVINNTSVDVYIAWVEFQRRQLSMQSHIGYECIFLPIATRYKSVKPFFYIYRFVQTVMLLARRKPRNIWIQVPQVPALLAALCYKAISGQSGKVIADCHNSLFRAPWLHFPFLGNIMQAADVVIVHNDTQMPAAKRLGVKSERLMVVEDAPAVLDDASKEIISLDIPRPWFVFPASFAEDEPVIELLSTAKALPDFSFIITGHLHRARNAIGNVDIPNNVHLLGYLDKLRFDSLLVNADIILALTKYDGIQLSVCNEAVGAAKPMIVSNTPLLKRLFPVGTVFTDVGDSAAMRASCIKAYSEKDRLKQEIVSFRSDRQKNWVESFEAQMISHRLIDRH